MAGSALESLRTKIDGYLRRSFPGVSVDDHGDFMISYESAITWVRAADWEGGHTLVRVWSISNVGMPVSGELTKLLVTLNTRMAMGGFRLDESGPAVMVIHTLLGDYLNRAELEAAVSVVTTAANDLAPEIKGRFGGMLFTES